MPLAMSMLNNYNNDDDKDDDNNNNHCVNFNVFNRIL